MTQSRKRARVGSGFVACRARIPLQDWGHRIAAGGIDLND